MPTGAHLQGATPPCWQSVLDLLGSDIAVTANGAVLIECNENTGHGLYQLASGRGVLNADFPPIFDKITARIAGIPNAFESKTKACQKAKAHFQLPKTYLNLRPYLFPNTSTGVSGV